MTIATLCGAASAQTKKITLEDIWSRATFRPSGISSIRSMQDGEHYCVLTRTGIEKYSYKTGEKVAANCAVVGLPEGKTRRSSDLLRITSTTFLRRIRAGRLEQFRKPKENEESVSELHCLMDT